MNLVHGEETVNVNKSISRFALSENDVGSSAVQVEQLTLRIKGLTEHMKKNKKDNACKFGLIKLVSHRSKLLKYIKRRSERRGNGLYNEVISALGIRK